MTRKFVLIMAALALLVMGMAAAANADTFSLVNTIDDFAYQNYLINQTAPIIENFQNNQINTPGLTIDAFGVDQAIFQNGTYQNVVDDATNSYQVVNYSPGMYGFGGWFDLANPGGPGSSIDVYVGADFVGTIPNTYAGEFWGFFSDTNTPFSAVTLQDANLVAGAQETYQIVDMAMCAVPLPPSALLLGTGLLGLVGLRFRRKLS